MRPVLDFLAHPLEPPRMDKAVYESDVLIVGGGLAGMPLALALAQGGLSVTLVDALDPATATGAGFDGRVSAIAFSSCRMLKRLDVIKHLNGQMQTINDIVVSDGRVRGPGQALFLHFDPTETGRA